MSRNSKNAKRTATSRTQKRTEGFKGPAKTIPQHGKAFSNRSKYNTKNRSGKTVGGKRERTSESAPAAAK